MRNIIEKIVKWLKDYSEQQNFCFVVGVSGGVDSAVVSTLCAKTGVETHVVSIPINQNKNQLDLARQHISWLKKNHLNVISHEEDLTDLFHNFKEKLSNYDNDLAWANTKSRLRMVTLYQIATYFKGLVVGTGNKIEDFGIGFFTKYGDGGVDISPIADLTKTEVREIARELSIIENIIKAKPTDGLWEDDRTDEEQIGTTYEELEWAMNFLESLEEDKNKILLNYLVLNNKNKHKTKPIPIFKKKY